MVKLSVVPTGWVEHHRPVVAGFFAGTILLERKTGQTTTDPDTKKQTPVWATVYAGPGLIELSDQQVSATDSVGTPLTVSQYVGRMPIEVIPAVGDRVTSTASRDPKMIGQAFTVVMDETQDLAVDRQVTLKRSS